jgi:hypothetical protein
MTDKPTWDRNVAHVADYGIDLVTAKGATGITWAAYGNSGYELQLSRSPLLTRLAQAEFCSAAGEQPCDAGLGQAITEAGVRWLDVTWGEQETTGPVARILRFAAAASIVIACGSWSGPQSPCSRPVRTSWSCGSPGRFPCSRRSCRTALPAPAPSRSRRQRSAPSRRPAPVRQLCRPPAGHYRCYPARPPDGRQR